MTSETAQIGSSIVARVYEDIGSMAATFRLKPRERLNEGEIAKQFGTSRTPVREALNRLVADGLLTFDPGKGFYCRELAPKAILDLYELRVALECEIARLTAERADRDDLKKLETFLDETGPDNEGRDEIELVRLDEHFHGSLAELTGNQALVDQLAKTNLKIRFIRWIDMEERRRFTQNEHRAILEAIMKGDGEEAATIMRQHILSRREDIVKAVREGYSRIYLDPPRTAEVR
ncbi:MAG: GntR family transcriptional regulator [Pseudomonadota bacterium]